MKINDFFQEAYCINLDRRKERWESSSIEFEKNNIKAKRFPAVDGNELRKELFGRVITKQDGANEYGLKKQFITSANRWDGPSWGMAGLNLTHQNLIKEAKEKKIESIIIFEDDVSFIDNFESEFFDLSCKVPEDWDMLYLGGYNEIGLGDKICDRLYRCKWTLTAHAVGIHSRMYNRILDTIDVFGNFIDVVLADMHSSCKAYVFSPFLATQNSGYSDIQYKHKDYQGFIK